MASHKGSNKLTRARPVAPASVGAAAEGPAAKPAGGGRASYRCPLSVPMRVRFRVGGHERLEVTATENFKTAAPWPGVPEAVTVGRKAALRVQ